MTVTAFLHTGERVTGRLDWWDDHGRACIDGRVYQTALIVTGEAA